mgnify:CR=1 FL=1
MNPFLLTLNPSLDVKLNIKFWTAINIAQLHERKVFEGKTPYTVILDHLESKEGHKIDLMNHFVSESREKSKDKINVMNPEDYLGSTHKEV